MVKREHRDNDSMNNNEFCKCESPNIFKLLSIKSNKDNSDLVAWVHLMAQRTGAFSGHRKSG